MGAVHSRAARRRRPRAVSRRIGAWRRDSATALMRIIRVALRNTAEDTTATPVIDAAVALQNARPVQQLWLPGVKLLKMYAVFALRMRCAGAAIHDSTAKLALTGPLDPDCR